MSSHWIKIAPQLQENAINQFLKEEQIMVGSTSSLFWIQKYGILKKKKQKKNKTFRLTVLKLHFIQTQKIYD